MISSSLSHEVFSSLGKSKRETKIKNYILSLEKKIEDLNATIAEALNNKNEFQEDIEYQRRRGDRYKRQLTKLSDKNRLYLNQLKDATILSSNRLSRSHSGTSFTESDFSSDDDESLRSVSFDRSENSMSEKKSESKIKENE